MGSNMHKWNVTATLKERPLLPATFESNGGRYFRNCTVVFTKVKLADGPKTLCHDCCSVQLLQKLFLL